MVHLPPEIIAHIISYLAGGSSYNATFQKPARSVCTRIDAMANLDRGIHLQVAISDTRRISMAGGHQHTHTRRLGYLRTVLLSLDFSGQSPRNIPQTVNDGRHAVFTAAIRSLFNILHSAPVREVPYITIILEVSPSQMPGTDLAFRHGFYLDLQLDENEELHELLMVSYFTTEVATSCALLSSRSVCQMASKMILLKKVKWVLSDFEMESSELRIQQ